MLAIFLVFLFIFGTCLGSFLCCQARRLHFRATGHRIKNRRSICLHCHHQLKWYDNLPIISWLILKGKCRHCHKKIGIAELISELAVGISFLLLGTTINVASASVLEWYIFTATIILVAVLAFLAIYDGLYGELPTVFLYLALFLAIITAALKIVSAITTNTSISTIVINPLLSAIIFGGIYLFLYKVSKGKWVGDGDWLLCLPLGLVLAEPILVFVALFVANLLACLVMLPIVQKTKNHQIYFGPFLVVAFVITLSIAKYIHPLLHF